MTPYERLYLETTEARNRFLAIPLVKQALATGGSRELYLDFLTQAYHHVKHTFPLLALASSMTRDERYQAGLVEYMTEERGHEKWILDDIRAMGGDAEAVARGKPGMPCQVMVGYCYYAIQWISPYAILGMVHVLEGLSVQLAHQVAGAVQRSLAVDGKSRLFLSQLAWRAGCRACRAVQEPDQRLRRSADLDQVIEATRVMYRLYGAIFEDMGAALAETARAA